eukprot:Nk52_evm9s312 gene=Nk52_evmTU9s312
MKGTSFSLVLLSVLGLSVLFTLASPVPKAEKKEDLWSQEGCCKPGDESCWPNNADIDNLAKELEEGKIQRSAVNSDDDVMLPPMHVPMDLNTDGVSESTGLTIAQILAPIATQPLYGKGRNMKAVYVQQKNLTDEEQNCNFFSANVSEFCAMSMRNMPMAYTKPQIVTWPTKAEHVQKIVLFARKHNLCLSVVNSGHDYINRHSNGDSLVIRTGLLKSVEMDLEDKKGFGVESVKVGAGVNDIEASMATFKANRTMVHGWCPTVGVVGFSLGGGFGVSSGIHGFGSDNILEAEVVLADGRLVTAKENGEHHDLWWALRGGAGSTWGVIVSLTARLYEKPKNGYTYTSTDVNVPLNDKCLNFKDMDTVRAAFHRFFKWTSKIPADSGHQINSKRTSIDSKGCATWTFNTQQIKNADSKPAKFAALISELTTDVFRYDEGFFAQTTSFQMDEYYANQRDISFGSEYISPTYTTNPNYDSPDLYQNADITLKNRSPSAIVNASVAFEGQLADFVFSKVKSCAQNYSAAQHDCHRLAYMVIRQDMPGFPDSPKLNATQYSYAPAFRTGVFNAFYDDDTIYSLGDFSYSNESSMTNIENWRKRYWGSNYERLLAIKRHYDKENMFWCRHCVGSEDGARKTIK